MESIVLKTPGISCSHCQAAITGAVGRLAGASDVKVDLSAKAVTVTFDPALLSPDAIKEAIEGQGYDVV